MNELELLDQLQTIKAKLENKEKLTDDEYKLFAYMLFAVALGIIETSTKYVLNLLGDHDER